MPFVKRQPSIAVPLRPPRRHPLRWFVLLLCVLVVPPAVPHLLALRKAVAQPRPADVLFVLSGGEGRIPAGYRAWASGAAKELFILGAGRKMEPARLVPEAASLPPEALRRIHVEGWSQNTLENAFSAKSIVSERGYTTAILVTSNYHVPRAYLVFRKVLPQGVGVEVLSVPSDNGEGTAGAWRSARRYFLEGWKYWGYRILLRWE